MDWDHRQISRISGQFCGPNKVQGLNTIKLVQDHHTIDGHLWTVDTTSSPRSVWLQVVWGYLHLAVLLPLDRDCLCVHPQWWNHFQADIFHQQQMQLLLNGSWSQNTDRKHCYNIYHKKTIVEYIRFTIMRKKRQFTGTAVSVNIFSMKILIKYTVFMSPRGDGTAISKSSSKPCVDLAARIYPWTSRSVEWFIQNFLGKNQELFKD